MKTSSFKEQNKNIRTYQRSKSVVFLKTKEKFGGLSNMAAGFPLKVNGINIRTSEALYQACRFPDRSDLQQKIIDAYSPMTAKMLGKPFRQETRKDWDNVRIKIMSWCLRVKLAQNWDDFRDLLLKTGDSSIVEQSRRDSFWGAKADEKGKILHGMNVLGRLLMELREELKKKNFEKLKSTEPLDISNFFLLAKPIETVVKKEIIEHQVKNGKDSNATPRTESFSPTLF
ncbi:NADAR family protein [Candidatus Mycalebacterium sp.]